MRSEHVILVVGNIGDGYAIYEVLNRPDGRADVVKDCGRIDLVGEWWDGPGVAARALVWAEGLRSSYGAARVVDSTRPAVARGLGWGTACMLDRRSVASGPAADWSMMLLRPENGWQAEREDTASLYRRLRPGAHAGLMMVGGMVARYALLAVGPPMGRPRVVTGLRRGMVDNGWTSWRNDRWRWYRARRYGFPYGFQRVGGRALDMSSCADFLTRATGCI